MSTNNLECPPLDSCGTCGTLPSGFVRLRYFFGKRMGVADFVDEQRYHAGKQRFHNQRLHGAGVLCGLSVTRQDPTDLILRVGKGAAIDACGRELLVGYDQCIDLDAWYARQLIERRSVDATWPQAALDADGNLPLWVAIRYRDCATGPEPAPRDTCSCDAAGCDFGRVNESFELDLWTANDPRLAEPLPLTPARSSLDALLGSALGGSALTRALADAASVACGESSGDGWLPLASFIAELTVAPDGSERIADVLALRARATLLAQSALLQELLARELAAQLEAGALVDGPEVEALTLEPDAGAADVYWLELALSAELVPETVLEQAFVLSRLLPSGPSAGWSTEPTSSVYEAASASTPAKIRVRVDNSGSFLTPGGLYRLALDPDIVTAAAPIVDAELRPLRPLRPSFHFGIEQSAADLVLSPAPYAR